MKLSIIAVVINNYGSTLRFISSIRDNTNTDYELILIDNASTETKTKDLLVENADKLFEYSQREDLAKTWNKGIALSTGTNIAIANNDTVVPSNWYTPLERLLSGNKTIGMVSPLTYWTLTYNSKLGRIKNFTDPFQIPRFRQGVWGEFNIFPRKVLEEVGGFWDGYPNASGEDLDMLYTLHEKNYKVMIHPEVFVFHEGGATADKILSAEEKELIQNRNWEIFINRWKKYENEINMED